MKKRSAGIAALGITALLSLGLNFSSMAADNEWKLENGIWHYYDNGVKVRNDWKKSGAYWFYLDSNGEITKNTMVDDRYVNEDGAMVTNSWRKLYIDGEENWYYFSSRGTMEQNGWRTINGKRYHFEGDGKMNYGWFDDNQYYLGGSDDGAMKTGWHYLEGPEDSESEYESNHYYFNSDGVAVKDNMSRNINGYTYAFDTEGRMLHGWVDVSNKVMADHDDASSNLEDYRYFKDDIIPNGIDGSRQSGWKRMEGPENVESDADDYAWYFFKDGAPYAAKDGQDMLIKSINGRKYCFNQSGEMQHGLQSIAEEGNSTATGSNAQSGKEYLYYFGVANDGAMKTGVQTVFNEDEGERFTYYFNSNGQGHTGIKNDYVYVNGKRLTADRDYKYQVVSDGEVTRLVNSSGKIQKGSTGSDRKFIDSDGNEFMVNRTGEITSKLPDGYVVKTK